MIELALLEADAVAPERLEVEIDDVVLPPEFAVGDRFQPILAGVLAPVAAPAQQAEEITFAYPNIALTFSAGYLAEDRGFYAKHGLKVKGLVIRGRARPTR